SPPLGQLKSLSLLAFPSMIKAVWRHRGLKWQHYPTIPESMLHTLAITSGNHLSVSTLSETSWRRSPWSTL
ncbi:hypothetical protein BJ878DRAFT_420162, partial [Calycina marina]